MEARFTMTPEAKEFLYGPSGKAEYVVYGPVNIEVELKSGEINRPQEIRERVTRCRDCEYARISHEDYFADGKHYPTDTVMCERQGKDMWPFKTFTVSPNGFCAWGYPREDQDA